MARANAFSAQADNPSALFYNPAGIGQLSSTQVSLGTTIIRPAYTFESSVTGQMTETEAATFFPVTLYFTHELRPNVHLGLGAFTPFGLSTEWPATWEGRYVTTFSEINSYYINPNVAWSPNRAWHLAAGISYVPSSVTLKNKLELTPSPDGEAEIEADGSGLGYNIAALTSLPGNTTLGLSFRSAVKIDYQGDANFAGLGLADDVRSSLTFPPMFTIGVRNRPVSNLTFELDWHWVGWSSVDKISIDFVDPAFPLPDVENQKNWSDSYSIRVGVEGSRDHLTLRAGYAYDVSPVPSETIDPSLPDSDKHTLAVGGGYRISDVTIDLAYMFVSSKDRRVANTFPTGGTPFDHSGKYSSTIHELGFGVSYQFD